MPAPPPTQPAPVAPAVPGAYPPPTGGYPPPAEGYPPPTAPGWGAGGTPPPPYGGPPASAGGGGKGGGGKKVALIVLAVVGAILVLFVGAAIVIGALSDDNDAEVTARTTLASTSTTEIVKPGDSALDPSDGTTPPDATTINVFDLAVGDCFDVPNDGNITNVDGIDCAEPHDNEVFGTFDIDGGPNAPFPGEEAVSSEAQDTCLGDLFTEYVGVDFQTSRFQATSINPTEETWTSSLADREVICVATSADGSPLTESVRGSNE